MRLEGIYSLYDNETMVNDKYGILKDAITEILKNGNSSNNIELLRDFNGFAWYIEPNEFEDIYSNLIFQDIRIIAGNDLLKDWIYNKNKEIDYIAELKKELNRRYDQEMAEQLFNQIIITILKVYIERHPAKIKELEIQEDEGPQDMKKYVEEISRDKNYNIDIKNIKFTDELITKSNKEYIKYLNKIMENNNIGIKFYKEINKEKLKNIELDYDVLSIKKMKSNQYSNEFLEYFISKSREHLYVDGIISCPYVEENKLKDILILVPKKDIALAK